jgi:hypothetical protein
MMTGYTQVIRFSLQVEEGVEWFCAQWVTPGDTGTRHRRHFPQVSRFRSWLLEAQGYGVHEADALIEQLRRPHAHANDMTPAATERPGRSAD